MKLNSQIGFLSKIGFLDKLLFTKHLAIMIKSGIPLSEAITSIADQTSNLKFKQILESVVKDIQNGQSLEKSLSKYPKLFDSFYLNLINVGEESGTLESNLLYLAEQLKKEYSFRQKVVAASLYPMIILSTAVIVGGGISFFVLPKLVDLFKSLDTELPLATKILLGISTTLRDYGIFIFAGIFALGFIFRLLLLNPSIRVKWEKFLLSLPVIGLFIQNVQMTSFCRNMGIMLKSGLPIVTSLEAEKNATTNLVFKDYIDKLLKSTETGTSLADSLDKKSFKYIPKIATKMIGVGEKTGKLDESFLYLADFFEDEVDNSAKNFSNVLEPVLLLVIGLLVAFVSLAIISPIYQFTSSVKR